jgi:ribosomal protein S18 acetylase RimI-like enzyme
MSIRPPRVIGLMPQQRGRGQVATRPFDESDRSALIALWTACDLIRPWNDPNRDIDRKLGQDPAGLIVLDSDSLVVGAVMVGYDGHRGWVNYLAVHPDHRRHGHGARLMAAAEAYLGQVGCPKANLQVRRSNHEVVEFYTRLGYAVDDTVSLGKRLVDDDNASDQGSA